MSNTNNQALLERAAELSDYYESTIIDAQIEQLIADNDLEGLAEFVDSFRGPFESEATDVY